MAAIGAQISTPGLFLYFAAESKYKMAGGADKRQQFVSRIANATSVVYNQLGRLKLLDGRFASMEAYYLEQISTSIRAGNNTRAKMIATELSNVRRIRRTTQHMGLALEALVIRFSTINEFATILDTIDPTVEMIKGIHMELTKAIPAASQVFSDVSAVTSDVLLNANIRTDARISTPMDVDALSILNEVEGALEYETKAKLPEVPSEIPSASPAASKQEEQPQGILVES
jgi:division protein CdvB (Snf7/Vps24/ESCRT-III family)